MAGPGTALQGAFTSGELAPSLSARVDLDKYVKGCRTMKNFFVQAHGGAVKRPGFELLDSLPGPAALIPFVFNQAQAYCLVFGDGWLRVATHEGFVLSGDAPYQITSPYTLDQARELSTVQSADILFIACRDVIPHKLKRYGHAEWSFEAMSFTAPFNPPGWNTYVRTDYSYTKEYNSGQAYYYVPASSWTDPETGQTTDYPAAYYPINKNLYSRTASNTNVPNISFTNGAVMSDGSNSPAQLTTPYSYYVTAVNADGKESEVSAAANITGPATNNWQGGDYITINWQAVSGAAEYRIYRASFGGRPAFIAETTSLTYNDNNVSPVITDAPPKYEDPFPGGDYPGTVSIFEQRLVFASSRNRPQTIWMSKSGDYDNHATYDPIGADSPLELTIASKEVSGVDWIASLRSLILGTAGMEWEVSARGEEAFSGKNAKVTPQSYWGSSLKDVITIGNVLLHVSSSGRQVRNLQYDFTSDSYGGTDLSILAAHLLENGGITNWTYQKYPDSIVWCVREDGALLGLTFQNEHQVAAWHQHHTQGLFEAVCALPHGWEHSLFAVVERAGAYYLERMAERFSAAEPEKAIYLDGAVTYEGEPKKEFTGLEYLEGKEIGIYADGAVQAPRTVQGGKITLDHAASRVTVGLSYTAELETMPVEVVGQGGSSVALKKTISSVDMLFRDSLGVKAGLSFAPGAMQEIRWRSSEPYGKPPKPFSGMKSVTMPALAENVATVCVRSDTPTPVTVLAIVSRIKVNAA
ncbi:MAG: hypothetical protein LBR82_00255 [Desulfovibrio sp.]|jgi:hypothetical protein|nr:hypothetical protein [Desulfovibrio sp.]